MRPQSPPAVLLEPPGELGEHGRAIWEAVGPQLVSAGVLAATDRAKGVRVNGKTKGNIGGNVVLPPVSPTLSELGLTKRESSEAQLLASLPEERFQAIVTGAMTIVQAYGFMAERRIGEMLAATDRAKGTAGAGRPRKGGRIVLPPNSQPTLSELGLTKRESSEAKRPEWPLDPECYDDRAKTAGILR